MPFKWQCNAIKDGHFYLTVIKKGKIIGLKCKEMHVSISPPIQEYNKKSHNKSVAASKY